jgi:hypothetical protein
LRRTAFMCLVVMSTAAGLQTAPRLPYESPGACPFECCTYRAWTVDADTNLLTDRRDGAPVLFAVRRGAPVVGVTVVVVTTEFGRAVAQRATQLGPGGAMARPGDELLLIHYLGEGEWKYWFRGRLAEWFLPDPDNCQRVGRRNSAMFEACAVQVRKKPRTTWWVKVRNREGMEGWTRQVEHFGNIDRRGTP